MDDVIEDEIIENSTNEGIDLAEEVIRAVVEREDDDATIMADGILFSVWVSLTQYLAYQGWTTAQLIKDVEYHSVVKANETYH